MGKPVEVSVTAPDPQNFEEILESLGGFGKFQIFILVLLLSMEIPAAFVGMMPIFTGRAADVNSWTCDGEQIAGSDLCSCNGTLSAPPTSIVAEWALVCNSAWLSDFSTSLQMLGMVFGNILTSQVSDWYGRRITYLGTSLLLLGGTMISALAGNPYIFCLARFICGVGFAGYLGLTVTYTIEFLPTKWRQLSGSVGPFGYGTMLLALIAYYVRPWRTLLWVSATPYLALFIIIPLLPESPRWLLRNKRITEAHTVFNTIARLNGTRPIKLQVLEGIAKVEEGTNGSAAVKRFSYLDFFRYKELRTTTICLMAIWSSWSLSYFGLTYNIKNTPGNIYLNVMFLGLADALGFPSFLFTGNLLGRRRSLVLFTSISSVFLVAIALIFLTLDASQYPGLIVVFAMIAKYGTAGARSGARCLTGESFPTAIRSMGTGITACSSGITGFVAPQLVFLGSHWPSVPYFAFALISVVGSMFAFLMRETSGKPLSDEIIRRISIAPNIKGDTKEEEGKKKEINTISSTDL